MPVLRELITRFGFDVSKKDVGKYDKAVSGMSKRALKLGATVGAAFSVKGLVSTGLAAQRAVFQLKRMAGTDFSKFQRMLINTRKELEGIKEGAGDLITDKNFSLSASSFIEELGHGADAMKVFNDLFSFAARQSALTGKNVNVMMASLQQGISAGNFDFLKELPEFDQVSINTINALNKIFEPGEIGGQLGIEQRTSKLRSILKSVQASQEKSLSDLPDALLQADLAAKRFQDTMDKTGKITTEMIVPAIGLAAEALKRTNKLAEAIGNIEEKGAKEALLGFEERKPIFKGGGTINREVIQNIKVPSSVNREVIQENNRPSNGSSEVNINNTFHITTDDPRKAATIAVQKMNEEIRKARSQLIPTEAR